MQAGASSAVEMKNIYKGTNMNNSQLLQHATCPLLTTRVCYSQNLQNTLSKTITNIFNNSKQT